MLSSPYPLLTRRWWCMQVQGFKLNRLIWISEGFQRCSNLIRQKARIIVNLCMNFSCKMEDWRQSFQVPPLLLWSNLVNIWWETKLDPKKPTQMLMKLNYKNPVVVTRNVVPLEQLYLSVNSKCQSSQLSLSVLHTKIIDYIIRSQPYLEKYYLQIPGAFLTSPRTNRH